jgi:outer membrane protein
LKLLLSLFLFLNLWAQDDYSFRVLYGKSTSSDLSEILTGNVGNYSHDFYVLALEGGYLLREADDAFPLDIYVKAGLSYFDEAIYSDVYEGLIYIKLFYNLDFLDNRVRLGLGEGFSYTSDILMSEYIDTLEKNDATSQFLNYLDLSVDVDLGMLFDYKPLENTALGFAIKHRSGVFGLINNVSHGGSNYNSIYIEKNF